MMTVMMPGKMQNLEIFSLGQQHSLVMFPLLMFFVTLNRCQILKCMILKIGLLGIKWSDKICSVSRIL